MDTPSMLSRARPLDTSSSLLSPCPSLLFPDHNSDRNVAWETQGARADISARTRAYPSPPMDGAPTAPTKDPRELYNSSRGSSTYSAESVEDAYSRKRPFDVRLQLPPPQAPMPPAIFPSSYPQRPAMERPYSYRGPVAHPNKYLLHEPQHGMNQGQSPQHSAAVAAAAGSRSGAELGQSGASACADSQAVRSPKAQRKTKGHVASACVPCKRAHLRCDAQRPCSRCISNGKEDACVDVQHKKRGRPRLRDDRDTRFENIRQTHAHSRDMSPRRPVDIHPSSGPGPFDEHYQRHASSRASGIASAGRGYSARSGESAPSSNANSYNSPLSASSGSQEPVAYLNMSLDFIKGSMPFWDTLGLPNMAGRSLGDIVLPAELEKISAIHSYFNNEQRRREPNYLPPILGRGSQSIQGLGFAMEDFGRFPLSFQDHLAFVGAGRFARSLAIRAGLAKEGSFYFIVLLLTLPTRPPPPQHAQHAPSVMNAQGGRARLPYQRMSPETMFAQRIPFDPVKARPGGDHLHTANLQRENPSPGQSSRPSVFMEHGFGQAGRPQSLQCAHDRQLAEGLPYRGMAEESNAPRRSGSQSSFQLPPIRPQPIRTVSSGVPTGGYGERCKRLAIDGLLGDSDEPFR